MSDGSTGTACKHAGGNGGDGFTISLPTLFEKSGAEGNYRASKFEFTDRARRTCSRQFHLKWLDRLKPAAARASHGSPKRSGSRTLDEAFRFSSRRGGRQEKRSQVAEGLAAPRRGARERSPDPALQQVHAPVAGFGLSGTLGRG